MIHRTRLVLVLMLLNASNSYATEPKKLSHPPKKIDEAPNTAPDAADLAKARDLVQMLGDAQFKVRDAAEKKLLLFGSAALEALKEGEKHADFHVRERCRMLQPAVRAAIRKARLDAFVARRDSSPPKDLPLAESFIKMARDSNESRTLYAEMLREYASFLEAPGDNQEERIHRLAAFLQEVCRRKRDSDDDLWPNRKRITRVDVAAWLLLATELGANADRAGHNETYAILCSPALSATLAKNDSALKNAFLTWLKQEMNEGTYVMERGLRLAANANLGDLLPSALELANNKKVVVAERRAEAVLYIAKVGNKDHIKDLEPLLSDINVVGNFQTPVELRDVALAACISLSGQRMADYHFDKKTDGDMWLDSYGYCAFSSNAKREESLNKFKASRKQAKSERK